MNPYRHTQDHDVMSRQTRYGMSEILLSEIADQHITDVAVISLTFYDTDIVCRCIWHNIQLYHMNSMMTQCMCTDHDRISWDCAIGSISHTSDQHMRSDSIESTGAKYIICRYSCYADIYGMATRAQLYQLISCSHTDYYRISMDYQSIMKYK